MCYYKVTIEYMEKYGINNVRGGSFCNIKLSEAEKEVLRKMIKTQNNKCFKCGQDGHYSNKCTEEWIDVSDSESESEYESEERYNKCFRCNRIAGCFGSLAQLVEQRTFNPLVTGSNPVRPTKTNKGLACASCGSAPFSFQGGRLLWHWW